MRQMRYPHSAILIFAKAPVEGEVKTRLIPALGREGATNLYRELLYTLINRLAAAELANLELCCSPNSSHADFQALSRLPGLTLYRQRGEDLGQRMAHAVADALQRYAQLILIGVDCPAMTSAMLEQSLEWLADGEDAVLGPAEDGGYVLLGLKQSADCLFQDIPWGTETVAEDTRQCLRRLHWRWKELPELWDLDRPQDLDRYRVRI